MSNLLWLTEVQMALLQTFFPKSHGKARVDDRRVLSGIIFVDRNGLRWRDAPREYGDAITTYHLKFVSHRKLSFELGLSSKALADLLKKHRVMPTHHCRAIDAREDCSTLHVDRESAKEDGLTDRVSFQVLGKLLISATVDVDETYYLLKTLRLLDSKKSGFPCLQGLQCP